MHSHWISANCTKISRVGHAGGTKRGRIFYENRFSKRQTFSGRNPAKFSSAGPEPEPENGAGYPAGTGLCRISGRFLIWVNTTYLLVEAVDVAGFLLDYLNVRFQNILELQDVVEGGLE